ncbi:MAG TPA: hypothetical protein VH234_02040 [Candidatus Saccharimonadales bacterium]|jgi:uncharacterized integral membrane protein|nr:hypothetical protein [Candidatus Saccharimonadales bacterium]
MKKAMYAVLILGFLFIDLLFFHDIFKPGEVTTLPQYLTGILSIPVIIISLQSLLKGSKQRTH